MSKYNEKVVEAYFEQEIGIIPDFEYRFHPKRRWRFDIAFPSVKVALEVEGGIFAKGRTGHTSIFGVKRDIEKYNEANAMGWHILRCIPDDVCLMDTVNLIKRTIENA